VAYATIDDVKVAAGGASRLVALSDVDKTGRLNTSAVAQALAEAEAAARTKVGFRYGESDGPVDPALRSAVAAEAVFILKTRIGMTTDTDMELHKERVAWFDDVGKGRATLGTADVKSSHVVDAASGGVGDLTNRRERYRGFS
jgi:phage gp36-like protein